MKLAFARDLQRFVDNTYGYSLASQYTKAALVNAGIELDPEAEHVFWWEQPKYYQPVPGKKNILYTVYESPDLSPEFKQAFDHPDTVAVIAPSRFCQKIFQAYTDKPVHYAPMGVDVDQYTYKEREWSPLAVREQTFTWLWLGAWNPRKGFDYVLDWWGSSFYGSRKDRLVLKTTGQFKDEDLHKILSYPGIEIIREGNGGFVLQDKNFFLDTRNLPASDICRIYHQAHAFVFPTSGEGIGYTLLEAMATGLPCVVTGWSGLLDYCDEQTAKLVGYRLETMLRQDGFPQTGAIPDSKGFCAAAENIRSNYREATAMGKRAAERMRARHTWEHVGRDLKKVLKDIVCP